MEINYEALKNNLIYVLKEYQIKVGYTPNSVGLNYPLDSLNRFLSTDCSAEEMTPVLERFGEYVQNELGTLKTEFFEGKYCITVPAKGVKYVHENVKDSGFLTEFIDLLRDHHGNTSIEDILRIFRKYSDKVRCLSVENDEFNYIVYFEDGIPDEFIYCIDIDLGHATYHRLTRADFDALGFEKYLK